MKYSASIALFILVLIVPGYITNGQETSDLIYHIVKENESARRISLLYNIPLDSIRRWNYLDRNYRVVEGMKLIIKHPQSKTQEESRVLHDIDNKSDLILTGKPEIGFHVVTEKDNLFRIALQYHVPVDSIKHWNNLGPNSNVSVGQRLIVYARKRETVEDKTSPVTKLTPAEIIPPTEKYPSGKKIISDNELIQVSDTSKSFEKALLTDSLLTARQQVFLPIYSDPVEKQKHKEPRFMEIVKYYYHSSNYLFHFVLFLNLFFFISSIALIITLITRRIRDGYIEFRRNKCQDRYRDFITYWLYDDHTSAIPESLIKELKDGINREVFTSELLSLHNNLIGESAEKLADLFHLAGFKKYSIQKVNRSLWHFKAKGFRELAQMKIKENYMIFKYLNSGNLTLRIEAQLAWIQLNPDDPLSFYDDPNVKLTEWGQLNLLLALKKSGKIPDFGRWLNSVSKSVSLFALKMAGNYKQFENVDLVAQRLSDNDQEIRREAICALGKMALPSQGYLLKQLFPKEELENRTEIIRSLTMMSESSNAPFFEAVLINESDVNLRILSAKGLVSLGVIGKDRLDSLFWDADPMLKKIIIHAKDDRI